MYMYDLIMKKRDGGVLTKEEIRYMISSYVEGKIPDYQMSAMLMAIYFKGMNEEETFALTESMAVSGDMVDLSDIAGIKVDKHSTGGVGDKTTLIISPIVASYGVHVAKMSGRGLGHTGGTIDKMEAIPNMRTSLSKEEFFDVVNRAGFSVIGQTGNIAPADKKLYALRDVTATVDSLPLIASSIMSKKLAAGSDCILLDVKTGSGAFMKTLEESISLSKAMVDIGEAAGKKTMALITDMDTPLGNNIGNSLEIMEAVEVLSGRGAEDLSTVCRELAANMLYLAGRGTLERCKEMVTESIENGSAFATLKKMVKLQGGEISVLEDTEKFQKAAVVYELISDREGYISNMNTETIGLCSCHLGAGRLTKDDEIDYSAGIVLKKKNGDFVNIGDVLAVFYTNQKESIKAVEKDYLSAITFSKTKPKKGKLIYARVEKNGVEQF